MPARLNGSTSGYTELAAPAVAGNNTLVLPSGNGSNGQVLTTNGSGALGWADRMTAAGPAFIAYKSGSNQSITANVNTKVTYATEVFDTASCYDTSTSRFTPNVAGFYQVSANAEILAVAASYYLCSISKNGSNYVNGTSLPTSSSAGANSVVSALIYLNGSTDYIEVFSQCGANATIVAGASEISTPKFSAFLARPA